MHLEEMQNLLKELGFSNIVSAVDGIQAWDHLVKGLPSEPFQLVLCDWKLPHMNGMDLLNRVRSHPQMSALSFILVSSIEEPADMVAAVVAGASSYIVKPATSKSIYDKMLIAWHKSQQGFK